MPRPTTHNSCPQCGQPKLRGSKVCMACHYQRNVSSVGTLRVKRREATRAEAMVSLIKASPKPAPKPAPVVIYEPAATSEQLVNVETGQPVKIKVGPSTVHFVQCPARETGLGHWYQLDQDNHGICMGPDGKSGCGAERNWPRPDYSIGWGDDGAMTWE